MKYYFFHMFIAILFIVSCSNSNEINSDAADVVVTSITLNKTNVNIKKGNSDTIVASVYPLNASDKRLIWISSNEAVASVSDEGNILAKNNGIAIITASTYDKKNEASCIVTVYQGIESLKITSKNMLIRKGESKKIDFVVLPSNAEEKVVWKSSDVNIVSVSEDGTIMGIGKGEAILNVSNVDNSIIDSCLVRVVIPLNSYNGYECVDLGLPSGILWAKANLGSNTEAQVGTYFYWGEVSDNDTGSSIYYIPESSNIDEHGFEHTIPSTYKDLGNIQGTQYDAARTNMGGNWMVPEQEDMDELWNYTKHEEVVKDGMRGLKFTSNNGNYIFLPAAGAMYPDGRIASYQNRCCITIATTTNYEKYAGYWGYNMSLPNGGWWVYGQERTFRHQVRGIVKNWY